MICSNKYYLSDKSKEDETGGTCEKRETDKN
jgi:hypothetical protein